MTLSELLKKYDFPEADLIGDRYFYDTVIIEQKEDRFYVVNLGFYPLTEIKTDLDWLTVSNYVKFLKGE